MVPGPSLSCESRKQNYFIARVENLLTTYYCFFTVYKKDLFPAGRILSKTSGHSHGAFSLLLVTNINMYRLSTSSAKLFNRRNLFEFFNMFNFFVCWKVELFWGDKNIVALSASSRVELMYQSIPNLTIPPGDPWGIAHTSCPWGRIFAPLSCPGGGGRVLNQNENSKILKKSAIFALSLKQMSSSSFHMFIYATVCLLDFGSVLFQ